MQDLLSKVEINDSIDTLKINNFIIIIKKQPLYFIRLHSYLLVIFLFICLFLIMTFA